MSCTLFIPDFPRAFAAAGRPRLPGLERILTRATRLPDVDAMAFLAPLFGLEAPTLAVAPFTRLADGEEPDTEFWLRADPVHLAPDRDQLVMLPAAVLEATQKELDALVSAFNAHYGAEGWQLVMRHPAYGHLRSPHVLDAVTHDPGSLAGRPVLESMPAGPGAAELKRLMNEVQMLFHTHPVNRAREEAGKPLINSLWLWGGGTLPAFGGEAPTLVVSDLPLVRGLALWAGRAPVLPVAADSLEVDSLAALAADDVQVLERRWFALLFQQVQSGQRGVLTLHLGSMGIYRLDKSSAWRFWRRPRPLPDDVA